MKVFVAGASGATIIFDDLLNPADFLKTVTKMRVHINGSGMRVLVKVH